MSNADVTVSNGDAGDENGPGAAPDPSPPDGPGHDLNELFPELYSELRRIARAQRRRHGRSETLSTTALVNEAYVRLRTAGRLAPRDRLHFLALSARAMRFILIDNARRFRGRRQNAPSPGKAPDAETAGVNAAAAEHAATILAVNAALERLATVDERLGRVVELRFFGGLSEEEIAGILRMSERTVRGDWQRAKLWLTRDLGAPLGET